MKVGDRVLFGKYSGSETKVEGTEYMIMREDDVLGLLFRLPRQPGNSQFARVLKKGNNHG